MYRDTCVYSVCIGVDVHTWMDIDTNISTLCEHGHNSPSEYTSKSLSPSCILAAIAKDVRELCVHLLLSMKRRNDDRGGILSLSGVERD